MQGWPPGSQTGAGAMLRGCRPCELSACPMPMPLPCSASSSSTFTSTPSPTSQVQLGPSLLQLFQAILSHSNARHDWACLVLTWVTSGITGYALFLAANGFSHARHSVFKKGACMKAWRATLLSVYSAQAASCKESGTGNSVLQPTTHDE